MFDHPIFRRVAQAVLLLAGVVVGYLILAGRLVDSASLAVVVLLGAVVIFTKSGLPSSFRLLLVIAGIVNVLGYVLTLWHERTSFDELVHAFTSFAGCAAITWLLIDKTSLVSSRQSLRIGLTSLFFGLTLGLLWEAFEWVIGIIGDRADTIMDLTMDMAGAGAASLLCIWAARYESVRLAAPAS